MSGPWGRTLRTVVGAGLIVVVFLDGGWAWLVAIPGAAFLLSGVFNYCPSGAFLADDIERSEFMASLKPTNLLNK